MLDPKWIAQNREACETMLKARAASLDVAPFFALEEKRKTLQREFDSLRAKQNDVSKEIQQFKKEKKEAGPLIDSMQTVAERIRTISAEQQGVEQQLNDLLLQIPNRPHTSVPAGKGAGDNPVVRTWGKKPEFDFKPKEHWELGEKLGI